MAQALTSRVVGCRAGTGPATGSDWARGLATEVGVVLLERCTGIRLVLAA